ncbi:MAG: hypothetical protein HC804_13500 [Anaerolineae bacterium]|nr:hypothetical protein [Anaerolineae bacterium]
MTKKADKYTELRTQLETLPHISPAQVEQWVQLQQSIDQTRDYLIRAVPQAQQSIDEAQKFWRSARTRSSFLVAQVWAKAP